MFGFFSLGAQELIVLVVVGFPVGVFLLVRFLTRRLDGRVAQLEAENRRLREELDGRRDRAKPGTAPDRQA